MKHKNTQPLYIFNRENPQNSEPQNGPRSGLDYIALFSLWLLSDNSQFTLVLKTPQVLLTYISGYENSIQKVKCKDKLKSKKCKKHKENGKCEDKKIWKKCMLTCKICTPGTLT